MTSSVHTAFDNRKILITGGAGFVGSNLVLILLQTTKNCEITVVDNLLSSERFNLPDDPYIHFIEGSIADDAVLKQIQDEYEYIFHLATFHGNQNSIFDPIADHQNNTLTTLKLYERIKGFQNIKKVVYSSAGCSVAVKTYEETEATTEDAPININQDSPYSISKIFGEFYSVYFFKQHTLPIIRARFQNVYGPREILGAGKWRGTQATIWRNVIPTFIYKALKEYPLPLENKGITTRDFIYVDDICRGLMACATKGKPNEVYNLATGKEASIHALALLINEITGNKAGFEFLPKRPWDSSGRRFGSIEKAKKELGFMANTELKDGLRETIKWTKQHLYLIEKCIDKYKNHITP